jgi:hypothetical protein
MHAVVVRVTIKDRESAQKGLNEDVVPRVSQAPGFQAGYWTWKDNTGLSMVIFDSEDGANQAGDQVRAMVESIDAVELESVEVREVVAHAWFDEAPLNSWAAATVSSPKEPAMGLRLPSHRLLETPA